RRDQRAGVGQGRGRGGRKALPVAARPRGGPPPAPTSGPAVRSNPPNASNGSCGARGTRGATAGGGYRDEGGDGGDRAMKWAALALSATLALAEPFALPVGLHLPLW